MSSNTQFLNKGVTLKAVLMVGMMVSAAYAVTATPASAFGEHGGGNSAYRHGGFGGRGHGGRLAGFNRGGGYRQGGYGYDNGYGDDNGYRSGRGRGGGIIGGLIGGY